MFQKKVYAERRQKLARDVGQGLILLLGNEESGMSYKDNCYPFRQDSSFLYFFGIDRPGLAAVIDADQGDEWLFGDDLSVVDMVWTGIQQPLAAQAEKVGVSRVERADRLQGLIHQAEQQQRKIHFLPPYRPGHTEKLRSLLMGFPDATGAGGSVTLIKAIVSQRSVKSADEVAEMEKAIDLTIDMQRAALQSAREGFTEARVAAGMHAVPLAAGCQLSFPIILTTHGEILHNHYGNKPLGRQELVLSDCGAESAMHYCGDLTRTFPVDGVFTTRQREVYEIVYQAHEAALHAVKPGSRYRDIHLLACTKLVEGLQQLGLMKGDIAEAVNQGAHALFFPCGLGHMLGLDTHDMENLGEPYVGYDDQLKQGTQFGLRSLRLGRALEPGFVITVEPGLYFIPDLIDAWRTEKKFMEFIQYDRVEAYKDFSGIRIEENVLVTAQGSRILGKPLPKTASGIEQLRQELSKVN